MDRILLLGMRPRKRLPCFLTEIGDSLPAFCADNRDLTLEFLDALIQRLQKLRSSIVKLILCLAERRHIPVCQLSAEPLCQLEFSVRCRRYRKALLCSTQCTQFFCQYVLFHCIIPPPYLDSDIYYFLFIVFPMCDRVL